MQKITLLNLIASGILLINFSALAKSASDIYEQAVKSTVVVANIDAKGMQQSMGSGVVMPDGDVVTNCHVLKDASRITVRVKQTESAATLRYSDWYRDVCALRVTGLSAEAAVVGSSKSLKVGAKVYAIGAPRGLELTLSDGIVSNLRELEGGRHIQTTAAISVGSSGGGLYDDTGALVGLTTFYFAEGQNLNFAVPIDWVKELPARHAATPETAKTATVWLPPAIVLEKRKDWPALLAHVLSWTKAQPHSDKAWCSLGVAYNGAIQTTQAMDAYQVSLFINPEFSEAWNNLGNIYALNLKYPQAINAYQQALRINPDDIFAWNNLGNAYRSSQQSSQAANAYQQALRINPDFTEAWNNLGLASSSVNQQNAKTLEAKNSLIPIDHAIREKYFNVLIQSTGR